METAEHMLPVLKLAAALGCGLMAGVFFAFSAFVMNALARLQPTQGMAAMQSINTAVLNPLFGSVFVGTALACLLLFISALWRGQQPGAGFVLAGSLLYLAGTLGVTMLCNVPLNNALAGVKPGSTEGAPLWNNYLAHWTAWNHVRAVAALAAAATFTLALYYQAPQ